MRRVYRQSLHLLNYTSAKRLGVEVLLTGTNIPEPNKGLDVTHRRLARFLFLYIDGGTGEERRKRLLWFFFFEDIDFEGLLDQEKSRLVFFDVDSYYSKEE